MRNNYGTNNLCTSVIYNIIGDFDENFRGFWYEFLNIPEAIKIQKFSATDELNRMMFETMSERQNLNLYVTNLPHFKKMEGNREQRFDEICDIIQEAMKQGYTPVEICVAQNQQMPHLGINNETGYYECRNFLEKELSIRFEKRE